MGEHEDGLLIAHAKTPLPSRRDADRNGKSRNCKGGGKNKSTSKRNRLVDSCTCSERGIGAGGQGERRARGRDSGSGNQRGGRRKRECRGCAVLRRTRRARKNLPRNAKEEMRFCPATMSVLLEEENNRKQIQRKNEQTPNKKETKAKNTPSQNPKSRKNKQKRKIIRRQTPSKRAEQKNRRKTKETKQEPNRHPTKQKKTDKHQPRTTRTSNKKPIENRKWSRRKPEIRQTKKKTTRTKNRQIKQQQKGLNKNHTNTSEGKTKIKHIPNRKKPPHVNQERK